MAYSVVGLIVSNSFILAVGWFHFKTALKEIKHFYIFFKSVFFLCSSFNFMASEYVHPPPGLLLWDVSSSICLGYKLVCFAGL